MSENSENKQNDFLNKTLSKVLSEKQVCIIEAHNKRKALEEMIEVLAQAEQVRDKQELSRGIFYREDLMSTGIGMGIAVPHVRLASIDDIVMCAGVCRKGLDDYGAIDGQPVNLIFMIAAGKEQHVQHIKLLSAISTRLKDNALREKLIAAKSSKHFYEIFIGQGK